MAVFRALMLLMLVASGGCFVAYAVTGRAKLRAVGLRVLVGALICGFVFFGVLILERVF